jgi:hypothetical protein
MISRLREVITSLIGTVTADMGGHDNLNKIVGHCGLFNARSNAKDLGMHLKQRQSEWPDREFLRP